MTTISSNRRKKFKLGTFVAAFFLCLALLLVFLFRAPLSGALWSALTPLLEARLGFVASAGIFFDSLNPQATLAAENARLRAELASTSIVLLDRELLRKENAELKLRLGRGTTAQSLLANVLLSPPGVPYDTLMIDVGKQNGVREGDLVAAEGSVYIGKVANAYDTTSRVVLFSSPGQTYQALLRGSIPISLSGQGGGSIVGEVPAGTEVTVGDEVVLPSISLQYVARVTSVVEREGESFKSVYLTLPVNPYGLRFVEVRTAPR
jgi:cell shape-determining protein MreC